MFCNPLRTIRPINEAYFGKSDGVKEIEKYVGQIKDKYKDDWYNTEINRDPLKYKLNKAIENAFGFNPVDVQFVLTIQPNMYTYSLGTRLGNIPSNNLIVKRTTGYSYDPKAGYACIICCPTGLFLDSKLTAAEVTAVMLHEIGHNFTAAQDPTQGIMSKIASALGLVSCLLSCNPTAISQGLKACTQTGADLFTFIDRVFEENSVAYKASQYIGLTKNFIFDGIYQIMNFISFLAVMNLGPLASVNIIINTILSKLLNPMDLIASITNFTGYGYTDERFADNFATMCGYGPELSSAFKKLDKSDKGALSNKIMNSAPFLKNYYDLSIIPAEIIIYAFDEHPHYMARLHNSLDMLEKSAGQKNVSPRMRARIRSDIKKIRSIIDSYEKKKAKANGYFEDPNFVRDDWYKVLSTSFKGDIAHKIYTRSSGDAINDRFEKLLKKSKKF